MFYFSYVTNIITGDVGNLTRVLKTSRSESGVEHSAASRLQQHHPGMAASGGSCGDLHRPLVGGYQSGPGEQAQRQPEPERHWPGPAACRRPHARRRVRF